MSIAVRPFTPDDYPRLAELRSLWEPEPVTGDKLREKDARWDPAGHLQRWMATLGSHVVGYAAVARQTSDPQGLWWASLTLDRPWRGCGYAPSLLHHALDFARRHGGTVARDYLRDDDPGARRFAERIGAELREHVYESVLDPAAVDDGLLDASVARAEASGARVLPWNGDVRRLYDLYAQVYADIPGVQNGWSPPFERFERNSLRSPGFRPDGVFIAMDGTDWVGLTMVEFEDGQAYQEMTGVLPSHRRRGLAGALKAYGMRWARSQGATSVRTNSHSANAPMLAINEKLGFRPEPGWFCYELDIQKTRWNLLN